MTGETYHIAGNNQIEQRYSQVEYARCSMSCHLHAFRATCSDGSGLTANVA